MHRIISQPNPFWNPWGVMWHRSKLCCIQQGIFRCWRSLWVRRHLSPCLGSAAMSQLGHLPIPASPTLFIPFLPSSCPILPPVQPAQALNGIGLSFYQCRPRTHHTHLFIPVQDWEYTQLLCPFKWRTPLSHLETWTIHIHHPVHLRKYISISCTPWSRSESILRDAPRYSHFRL